MKIFLTSDIGASVKVDGVRVVSKLNNTNFFADNLKKSLKGNSLMVFVASSPNYSGTASYANLTRESLALDGMVFENMVILEGKNMQDCQELMKKADLVFLAGGDTFTQMKMFEEMNLREHIKECKGVIVGQSAGALNLAEDVYCSPTPDESTAQRYWKGLGLSTTNIEPHFKLENKELIEQILLPDSKVKPFLAIVDGAYIYEDEKEKTLFGEAYQFKNGEMKQICFNGKSISLNCEKCLR